MAHRGWGIGEKHGKQIYNFLDEVIPIATVDFIMKVRNVNPSGHKEGQYIFLFISTLRFHSIISSTVLYIFPVQIAPFGVNEILT